MIIANLKKMQRHELGDRHEHNGHTWINNKLSCGCIIALCSDIKPTKEESDFVSKHFTKINNLQALLRETMNSDDQESKKRFSEFQTEIEGAQDELR